MNTVEYDKAYAEACLFMRINSAHDVIQALKGVVCTTKEMRMPTTGGRVQIGTRDNKPTRYDLDEAYLYNHPHKGHLVEEDTVSNFSEISDRDPQHYRENEMSED